MSTEGAVPSRRFSEHRRHVLCVDDAQPLLECLTEVLEINGYEVSASASPVQTAQMFVSGDFDLAILDYDMPAMNGAQLAAWLKTASPELKVILYTGALSVPRHELRFVDQMVHKSEGVLALLSAVETFLPSCHVNASQ